MSHLEETMAFQLRAAKIPFEREVVAIRGRKFRVDFLIDETLVLEVEGGVYVKSGHTTGAGITRDIEKGNMLTLAGYKVLRVTSAHIASGEALKWVEQARAA